MKEYDDSFAFWNATYATFKPEQITSHCFGAAELDEQLEYLGKNCRKVLDFGCGAGWAGNRIAYLGCEVIGFDAAENASKFANQTAKENNINAKYLFATDEVLDEMEENTFDGAFSSNTLDVIPATVADKFMQRVKRVVAPNSRIVIMLNPHFEDSWFESKGFYAVAPHIHAKDGYLRSINLVSDEWKRLFNQYFTVTDYIEFRFPGESDTVNRRLFILNNNKK